MTRTRRRSSTPASPRARDQAAVRRLDRRLLEMFGTQGWWPVTIRRGRLPVYRIGREGKPVSDRAALEIIIGAILTQNTAWKNVEKALVALLARATIDLPTLAEAGPWLEEAIRPSGYFRQKADRLRRTAREILSSGGLGALRRMPTPALRALLLSWHGIGPETADSILCYAFARPVFVVDAYTARLFREHGLPADRYDRMQDLVHRSLPASAAVYGDFHARIVHYFSCFLKRNG